MNIQKRCFTLFVALIFVALMSVTTFAEELPKLSFPVMTTSAGQSADIVSLNILAEEAGLLYDYCDVPDVKMIKAGVGLGGAVSGPGFHVETYTDTTKYPKGTPFKTIIMAVGASLKGMGASGLSVNDEIARLEKIIKYCKENKIFIVAVHLGGTSTRGAAGSDNEKMIDAVVPFADLIVVTDDGNKDGRFNQIAKEKKIPLAQIKHALNLIETLQEVFEL